MKTKHPAITAYEIAYAKIVNNTDDASWMPMGSGDVVGRARLEQELNRVGVQYPQNILEFFTWWENIGGAKAAKKLTRQFRKMMKEKLNADTQLTV